MPKRTRIVIMPANTNDDNFQKTSDSASSHKTTTDPNNKEFTGELQDGKDPLAADFDQNSLL